MRKYPNKTTSFLVPLVGANINNIFNDNFMQAYCGSVQHSKNSNWGEFIILEYNNLLSDYYDSILKAIPTFQTSYTSWTNTIHYVYSIPQNLKDSVVKPFLEGKYSKIDRNYVNKHYTEYTNYGTPSINWAILHKDQSIREGWESILGTSLPEDAEVASRPEKEYEVYGASPEFIMFHEELEESASEIS